MSDGNSNINFFANVTSLLQAMDKSIRKQQEQTDSLEKLAKTSKKGMSDAEKYTAAAAKEMDRFAKATKDVNRTPLEKYADEMLRLNRAFKAGKIDQETFNRAVAKSKLEFQQAGHAGNQAFGASAIGNLTSYAAGMVSVSAAIGLVTKALADKRAEENRLGEGQFQDAPSLAMLAQVADTPEDLKRLQDEAKKTFAEGGAKTIGEAAALQFSLESGGVGNLRGDFSRMQASGLVPNASLMAESAIKMTAGMGAAETGDFRSVVSKSFGAGKLGLGSAEELLSAAASTSSQASRLGLSDEELLASISTASAVVGPNEAATQIEALLKGIEVEGIGGGMLQGGKTLREQIDAISGLEKSGVDIRELLGGRQEAVKGFGILSSEQGRAAMSANLANIATSQQEDWFGQKVAMAEAVPSNAAAIAARQAKAGADLAGERTGDVENIADAVANDLIALQRRRNGEFMATLQRGQNYIDRFFGNETFIRDNAAAATPETQQKAERLGLIMDGVGEKLDRAASNLERASETNYTNGARANQAAAGGAVEAR
jgi:hypothetical protein